jgi:hypothetical protein
MILWVQTATYTSEIISQKTAERGIPVDGTGFYPLFSNINN